jgi:NhaA family Na+:H+ antiporter
MPIINDNLIKPFLRFLKTQNMGSKLLLLATLAALVLANSPYHDLYNKLLNIPISITIGEMIISGSLLHWINDGLMVIFFLVIGLEIKREILVGELAGWQKAGLPLIAALGGMLVPALIYSAINAGGAGFTGWGIPMATDIAFALGCLMILGNRIHTSLKVFLLAMAIVDDLGAIIVIAVFYTAEIHMQYLWLAIAITAVLIALNQFHVRRLSPYVLLGIILWLAIDHSGIHSTLAGVILAMTIPARSLYKPEDFLFEAKNIIGNFPDQDEDFSLMCVDEEQRNALKDIENAVNKLDTLLQRLEDRLHPFSALFIVPLFAFANAGVSFAQGTAGTIITSPITLGIIVGLLLGKQLGIMVFSFAAVKFGLAALPRGIGWKGIYGLSCLAGIGFTMSLFITNLSFTAADLVQQAKIGILSASLLAAIMGTLVMSTLEKND